MKNKILSSKTYVCTLCGNERKGNIDKNADTICWLCLHRLLNTQENSPEKIKLLYNKLIEKGMEIKAKLVEIFIPEEEETTYEKFERPLDRRRTHKQVGFTKQER